MRIDKMIWERDPRPGYNNMRGMGTEYRIAFILLPVLMLIVAYLIGVI